MQVYFYLIFIYGQDRQLWSKSFTCPGILPDSPPTNSRAPSFNFKYFKLKMIDTVQNSTYTTGLHSKLKLLADFLQKPKRLRPSESIFRGHEWKGSEHLSRYHTAKVTQRLFSIAFYQMKSWGPKLQFNHYFQRAEISKMSGQTRLDHGSSQSKPTQP